MNKALRERLDSWDLKSLVLTIVFLSVALFLFFYYGDIRDLFRANDKGNYGGQTKGEVISIEPIDRITQSKWKGTKIFIDSYKVSYRFIVSGQTFENNDIIPLSTENQQLLKSLLGVKDHATCVVKYDLKDPNKSVVFESE
jgi:hypothetical protein